MPGLEGGVSQGNIDQLGLDICSIAQKIMVITGGSNYGLNVLFTSGWVMEVRLEARMKRPGETFDTEVKVAEV